MEFPHHVEKATAEAMHEQPEWMKRPNPGPDDDNRIRIIIELSREEDPEGTVMMSTTRGMPMDWLAEVLSQALDVVRAAQDGFVTLDGKPRS